jgi:(2Fe-2S) ferredoxin
LRSQFKEELERKEVKADVGLISHIGGHKYAGNVIVYIPPSMSGNALSGMGIWYGRVEPAKVEGIIEETVFRGRIISELFRGGITKEGASLGRMLEEPMKRERGETGRLQLKPKSRT